MKATAVGNVVATFLRITGSSIFGEHNAVLYGGEGAVGGLGDTDEDQPGEQFIDKEGYNGSGLIFRPRPPETINSKVLSLEAMALRTPSGDVPVAWRDLRLHRKFPAPKAGTIALVGYGGGFAAFDDTTANSGTEKASKFTLYVPYQWDSSGVATKAHLIGIDPETESINLLHASGGQFVLLPNKQIMAIADNGNWWNLQPGKFEVQADAINLIGTVSIGSPTVAVNLLAGSSSQPSTRLKITTP